MSKVPHSIDRRTGSEPAHVDAPESNGQLAFFAGPDGPRSIDAPCSVAAPSSFDAGVAPCSVAAPSSFDAGVGPVLRRPQLLRGGDQRRLLMFLHRIRIHRPKHLRHRPVLIQRSHLVHVICRPVLQSVRNEFGGARELGGRGVKTSHRATDLDFELV